MLSGSNIEPILIQYQVRPAEMCLKSWGYWNAHAREGPLTAARRAAEIGSDFEGLFYAAVAYCPSV